jgi:hypothetical protein
LEAAGTLFVRFRSLSTRGNVIPICRHGPDAFVVGDPFRVLLAIEGAGVWAR